MTSPETYSPTVIPDHELLQVFPEGKKLAKELIKEYNSRIVRLQDLRQEIQAEVYRQHSSVREREVWTEIITGCWVDEGTKWFEKNIRKLNRILLYTKPDPNFRQTIERAKGVPIENFLDFKGGFAKCPWHNEKTASLKIYKEKNRVHCFGCGRGGDVIDVVQALNNCTLAEALKFIK